MEGKICMIAGDGVEGKGDCIRWSAVKLEMRLWDYIWRSRRGSEDVQEEAKFCGQPTCFSGWSGL